jgi:hypothetical protein
MGDIRNETSVIRVQKLLNWLGAPAPTRTSAAALD